MIIQTQMMILAVPPVTAVEVTVVLSVAFLPEFFGLHVIRVTVGSTQSVPTFIQTISATSKMLIGYAMIVCNCVLFTLCNDWVFDVSIC